MSEEVGVVPDVRRVLEVKLEGVLKDIEEYSELERHYSLVLASVAFRRLQLIVEQVRIKKQLSDITKSD